MLTFGADVFDAFILNERHVTEDAENDESGQKTREAINAAGEYGVSVTIVVEFVVRTKS